MLPFAVSSEKWRDHYYAKEKKKKDAEIAKNQRKEDREKKKAAKESEKAAKSSEKAKKKAANGPANGQKKKKVGKTKAPSAPKKRKTTFNCTYCQGECENAMEYITCNDCHIAMHLRCIPSIHKEFFPELFDDEWDEDFEFLCDKCFTLESDE